MTQTTKPRPKRDAELSALAFSAHKSYMDQIALALVHHMNSNDLTLYDIQVATRVTLGTLNNIIYKHRCPSAKVLAKLSAGLGIHFTLHMRCT